MNITLPGFEGTDCYAIVACGEVTTKSKKISELFRLKKSYATKYVVDGKNRWALAMFGGNHEGKVTNHYHVEATSKAPVPDKDSKAEILDSGKFAETIGVMIGKKIRVTVSGYFMIDISKLPEDSLISPAFFQVGPEENAFRTTRMEFEFEGTMFPRISWRVVENRRKLAVKMAGTMSGKIDEAYLTDFARHLDEMFRSIAFGDHADVPK